MSGAEDGPSRGPRPPGPSGESPRIHVLPDALIDQIAAGEVVERPASVVKELVENALDADARRLRIDVREGGRALVAVSDDGTGMTPAEARLAVRRHATSKLASAEDLLRIGTFGFRGEALPAIASVSRFRLRTRPRGGDEGFEIHIEGGRLVDERTAAGPEGTRIEVADLFAQVPARRKFLKTAGTEWGHAAEWLGRAALARPEIHFEIRRDDRKAIVWPATTEALDRVAAVLSDEEAAAMVPVDHDAPLGDGRARIHGFASSPGHHRGTAGGMHLYVNGRPVRDRLLRHAVMEIYRDVLPRGRFPSLVLFLDLPTEAVDVNVHPAKWEVRFDDPRGIHRLVRDGLNGAVAARRWLRGAAPAGDAGAPFAGRVAEPGAEREPGATHEPGATDWVFARAGEPAGEGALPFHAPASAETGFEPGAGRPDSGAPVRFGDLRVVGQLLSTYLLCEQPEGVLLVDQHAAHERILYERLRSQWLDEKVARQALLLPETVEMAPEAVAALEVAAPAVERLGFEVEPFGETAVVVRALPALLSGRSPERLVRDLAAEVSEAREVGAAFQAGSRILVDADRTLATMACHSARRAGEALSTSEQRSLLAELDTIPWAPTCPHGRPVAVPLTRDEIERRFARR
ncbi:MAG: DNA mismatch repair endonuclease MutL [Deltaproteobacteria bacterium]|nr:DNA mismatch repair endonuclease MutL [Deltaproteobacteria bacterium]MBW2447142.1 DNA mismatch repair endonuclease MutL [Deltaproteobacteria bacterium]